MNIRQYFKQGIAALAESPALSMISIAGTALAIAMIMVIVIVYEAKTANYKPETKRDRMMYVKYGNYESPHNQSTAGNNFRVIKDCFYPLRHTDAVTAIAPFQPRLISAPAGNNEYKGDVTYTDAAFWKVFDFRFLSGAPFTEADVESSIRKAVINETLARKLYGTVDITGKTVLVSFVEYTVAGVVSPISTLAGSAYGEVWLPHTTTKFEDRPWDENTLGQYRCIILASQAKDMPQIRAEAEENVQRFNTGLADGKYVLRGQPHTHFGQMVQTRGHEEPDVKGTILRYGIILLILLLVPAINLSSMTFSQMQKRTAETGIRKAFGATRGELVSQVLAENLVQTLIGSVLGLALSYLAIGLMNHWLLATSTSNFLDGEASVSAGMIFHPSVFLYALLCCLLMNLLSAGIPAWRVSGRNIVESLNEH